jgi:protein gp37
MGDKTGIQWTEATWNPVVGCEHVSAGCDNCYAASLASGRLAHVPAYAGLASGGRFNGKVRLLPDRLDQPLRWTRPRMIFVNSMSDLFHKDIPDEFIAQVFAVMALTPRHTYQILTKRHARMRSLVSDPAFRQAVHEVAWNLDREGRFDPYRYADDEIIPAHYIRPAAYRDDDSDWWPLPNVWLGVSVENQHWADIRIPALLATPAVVRFLSGEPLLGPVDLRPYFIGQRLHWVIAGGESGRNARPMHPTWARSIRDQCTASGVPFFFKQFGEWAPAPWRVDREPGELVDVYKARAEAVCATHSLPVWAADYGMDPMPASHKPWSLERTSAPPEQATLRRVGKHAAGRELDGRTWDEYPARAAA